MTTMDACIKKMAMFCGLQDPDDFAMSGGVWGSSEENRSRLESMTKKPWSPPKDLDHALRIRGTGRTTRMILEALVASEAGCAVEIVMACGHSACLVRERLIALWPTGQRHFAPIIVVGPEPAPGLWRGCSTLRPGEPDVRLVDHHALAPTKRNRESST